MDRRRLVTTLLLVALTGACAPSSRLMTAQWRRRAVAQDWVTAQTTMLLRRRPSDPFVKQVVASAGGRDRVVYRSQPTDWNVSEPVVSRDGVWLAFARIEEVSGLLRNGLYVVRRDGEDLRFVFELGRTDTRSGHKWTHFPPPNVAWSHDSSALLVNRNRALPDGHEWSADLLDVPSGTTRVLLSFRASPDLACCYPAITSQAWAPDGRRFVYTNGEGRTTIRDIAAGGEVDLGPGRWP